MRVLILGGSGFIGSYVVDEFREAGHQVVSLDRYPERFRDTPVGVEFVQADFGNRGEINAVLERGIDVVVHLVSSTVPQTSNDDPIYDLQSNLIESVALFEMCVKHGVRKVVFISSGGTVYGVPQVSPVPETHPTLPVCSYGITKLAIENYLHLFYVLHGLHYVVLRVSNPYGARQDSKRKQGVAAVFMQKMLRGEKIDIWGDGSIIRDFVHVSDVARACVVAAESANNGLYNVGSGQGVSIRQLVDTLQEVTGSHAKVNWQKGRTFDVPEIVLDCSRIESELSWSPRIGLEQGLIDMKNWMEGYSST